MAHSKVPHISGYFVESHIGSGSSGQVFRATHKSSRQEVVVKIIPLSNPWLKKEYEREITNLTRTSKSSQIVRLFEYFEYKNHGVIVLERLNGDLLDYIQSARLSVMDVKQIFRQICKAVRFLHKRDIAHLDLKPENVFLNSVEEVKLGDFGSSCSFKRDTTSVRFGQLGTRLYCAPEVRPNLPFYPEKADIWSLGIVLYVLLTGYWPFSGRTDDIIQRNIDNGTTSFLLELLPKDDELLYLLKSMLEVDPSSRPSIDEVLQSSWLHGDLDSMICDSDSTDEEEVEDERMISMKEESPRGRICPSTNSSLPKASSHPDMTEITAVPEVKSPRIRRPSLKDDEVDEVQVWSACSTSKQKKRRLSNFITGLLGKIKNAADN